MMSPFRFVVISDTHFFAPGKGVDGSWWNRGLGSQSERIAESMVRSVRALAPDLVIHCGDFTADSTLDSYERGVAAMEEIGCPWYGVLGNHDAWSPGVRGAFRSRFSAEGGGCYYSVRASNVRFIFLDSCFWATTDGSVVPYRHSDSDTDAEIEGLSFSRDQLQWLADQLNGNSEETVILVSHAPLDHKERYRMSTLPKGKRPNEEWLTCSEFGLPDAHLAAELRDIIGKHARVKMALAGHWHLNDVMLSRNTAYCLTSSLREYPFEFRLVEVSETAISVSTHGLDDEGLNEESYLSDWGNDWVRGTEADRRFVVKRRATDDAEIRDA